MGQQQLLLIVLGTIIIGIAVVIGINLFQQDSIDNKRDIVVNECQNLATLAVQYYQKPAALAGGGNSFTGWSVPNDLKSTANGSYSATVSGNKVVITGMGNEVVSGSDSIEVQTTVIGDSIITKIIN
jgi:hypothetical protein